MLLPAMQILLKSFFRGRNLRIRLTAFIFLLLCIAAPLVRKQELNWNRYLFLFRSTSTSTTTPSIAQLNTISTTTTTQPAYPIARPSQAAPSISGSSSGESTPGPAITTSTQSIAEGNSGTQPITTSTTTATQPVAEGNRDTQPITTTTTTRSTNEDGGNDNGTTTTTTTTTAIGNDEQPRAEGHETHFARPANSSTMGAIWMSRGELDLLLKYLDTSAVTSYLEWGSGGSTQYFPRYVRGRFVSIEHDITWCNEVRAKTHTINTDIDIRCVSVPRGTGGWGTHDPFEEGTYPVFKRYIDEIDKYNSTYWDFVLIDGRARVDAAIKALPFITDNSTVALHDSHRLRAQYGNILYYYDIVEEFLPRGQRGLAILRRKNRFHSFQGRPELAQATLDSKYDLK